MHDALSGRTSFAPAQRCRSAHPRAHFADVAACGRTHRAPERTALFPASESASRVGRRRRVERIGSTPSRSASARLRFMPKSLRSWSVDARLANPVAKRCAPKLASGRRRGCARAAHRPRRAGSGGGRAARDYKHTRAGPLGSLRARSRHAIQLCKRLEWPRSAPGAPTPRGPPRRDRSPVRGPDHARGGDYLRASVGNSMGGLQPNLQPRSHDEAYAMEPQHVRVDVGGRRAQTDLCLATRVAEAFPKIIMSCWCGLKPRTSGKSLAAHSLRPGHRGYPGVGAGPNQAAHRGAGAC